MYEIQIPRLGWSMEQGTFLRWLKKNGDLVKKGEPLFELEGDKNVQEIEAVEEGILKIPAGSPLPGATVDVGTLLGYLINENESVPEIQSQSSDTTLAEKKIASAGPAARRMAAEHGIAIDSIAGTGRGGLVTKEDVSSAAARKLNLQSAGEFEGISDKKASTPRARRIARENAIDWQLLKGTGRGGRIREADVLQAMQFQANPTGLASEGAKAGSLSPRRKAIAARLRRSQELTIPVTLHTTADVTELVALRQRIKVASLSAPPSFTDIIAALIPYVYRSHPQLSMIWNGDQTDLIPIQYEDISIGIAVDTSQGLLVPVISRIAAKTLPEITAESRRLIELARSGGLPGEAMRGGTLTISNLGSYGIDCFTPVINLPEIAILGLGAIRREPVFIDEDRVEARQRMALSLTFDHAAVDGAPAAAFLRDIAMAMADPAAFLLNSRK
jgi:pyruvate dehydrogenase E2 component (dihydrolipoamide acetyltransferase)